MCSTADEPFDSDNLDPKEVGGRIAQLADLFVAIFVQSISGIQNSEASCMQLHLASCILNSKRSVLCNLLSKSLPLQCSFPHHLQSCLALSCINTTPVTKICIVEQTRSCAT